MSSLFKKIFETKPEVDFPALLAAGAQLVDVRTPAEYSHGHLPNAINLPLQQSDNLVASLHKDRAIILYCASGSRSQQARKILEAHGFQNLYDGGGFETLKKKLT